MWGKSSRYVGFRDKKTLIHEKKVHDIWEKSMKILKNSHIWEKSARYMRKKCMIHEKKVHDIWEKSARYMRKKCAIHEKKVHDTWEKSAWYMRKNHENLQKLSFMRKKYVNLESKGSRNGGKNTKR
mgnify:CR=1 FL=1